MTTDTDGTAKVWDLGLSGDAEWLNLEAQPDWNSDVTFSPDGRWLLGSVPDSTVRVWDATSGEELLTLEGHQHPGFDGIGVAGIGVSPDGRKIATAGRDATARVWEASTGNEVFAFEGHTSWVEEVRFSPDGKFLATVSLDRTARIVDAATGRELLSLPVASTPEPVFSAVSLQFTPDGRSLVTASWDGSVRVFDSGTGAELDRIDVGMQVNNLAIDQEGRRVALATDERAMVWDLGSGETIATLARPAFAIAFSPDGRVALSDFEDGSVSLWDPSDDRVVVLRGHSGAATAVAFSPDGSRLASLGSEGTIRVWAVDLDDLLRIAEREVTRSLTDEECQRYLHVDVCPPR